MDKVVRRALPEDWPRVLEISKRTIRAAYGPILGQEQVDRYAASERHDSYFDTHAEALWVITSEGTIAGIAALSANMVDLLLIDPKFQGKGLGSMLLEAVEGELFREFNPIAVESWEANHRANRFYMERGWLEIGKSVDERTKAPKVLFMKERPHE